MDRLNGVGSIIRPGKEPVEVIFSENIIIEKSTQFGCCDWVYYVCAIILMVVFYFAIPLGLITKNSNLYGLTVVWVVYVIVSCCTNSTKYISNVVDIA